MSNAPPSRWYPKLEDVADSKSPFEVQTSQAMRQAFDYIYANNDAMTSAQASSPAQVAPPPADWWSTPYAADVFSASAAAASITVAWTNYKIAPTSFVNRKTPYLHVPNGSVTAAGLAGGTGYWFYPAFDTRSGGVVFAIDKALVVPGTVAHTAPSSVALMKAASGGNVSLSATGFKVTTGAGAVAGLGGGLLHGAQV
jgi:hypothetical protein